MLQNSLTFDTSDLPDQETPEAPSVVFDTSNLPDFEPKSDSTAAADIMPTQGVSEANHNYTGPTPFDLFQGASQPADGSYLENALQVRQDLWNQSLMDAQNGDAMGGPLTEPPLRPDPMGLAGIDPWTVAASDTNSLDSGANAQTAVLGDQSMPHINMLNIYKQWAIGGIDAILRALYEASGALDIARPYEPYQSPFSAPADVYDQTARLMGSFQLPALTGEAADAVGSLGGAVSTTDTVAKGAEQIGQEAEAAGSASESPGQWIEVNESMSASARDYQAQITGKVGQAHILNGVKFDGISNGALLEAKGPGYANFVKDGEFQGWFTGEKPLVNQAVRQMRAANGAPIEWHVADKEAVQALQKLFQDKNITGIKVIYTPALK